MPPQKPLKPFTPDELASLKDDPRLCRLDRRTFLKWSALLTSQAILGGGVLSLQSGDAVADDTLRKRGRMDVFRLRLLLGRLRPARRRRQ